MNSWTAGLYREIAFADSPETLDFAGLDLLPLLHVLDFIGRTGLYRDPIRRAVWWHHATARHGSGSGASMVSE
jgi:hypothetical protein